MKFAYKNPLPIGPNSYDLAYSILFNQFYLL